MQAVVSKWQKQMEREDIDMESIEIQYYPFFH